MTLSTVSFLPVLSNPQKARVLLMLALTQTKDPKKEIQKIF